jgi:hypothetical protein
MRPDYAVESQKPVIIKHEAHPFRVQVFAIIAGRCGRSLRAGEIVFNIVVRIKVYAAVAATAI